MSNHSIQYIHDRIQQGNVNNMLPHEFNNLTHIAFDCFIPDDNIQIASHPSAFLHYRPHANFNYFVTEGCYCDGTLIYTLELCQKILSRLAKTCYDPMANIIETTSVIHYEVGDFVVNSFMVEKSPDPERPWLIDRVTVMLPVRFYICG